MRLPSTSIVVLCLLGRDSALSRGFAYLGDLSNVLPRSTSFPLSKLPCSSGIVSSCGSSQGLKGKGEPTTVSSGEVIYKSSDYYTNLTAFHQAAQTYATLTDS